MAVERRSKEEIEAMEVTKEVEEAGDSKANGRAK
jgi:hypothetical protein